MFRRFAALSLLAPIVASCAATPRPHATVTSLEAPAERDWQRLATPADEMQIAGLRDRLAQARQAAARRYRTKIEAEGRLTDPAAAEPLAQLPPGPYHCRLLRFGAPRGFVAFPPDLCYVTVAPEGLAFTKASGSSLPQGYLYPDGDKRQVFLGTLRDAGQAKIAYGADPARDVVGVVERVSSFRWRLILSRAGKGAALDLYELVPVPPQVPGAKPAVPSD